MRKTVKLDNQYFSFNQDFSNIIIGDNYKDVQLEENDILHWYRFNTGSSGNMNVLRYNNTCIVFDCGVSTKIFNKNMSSIDNPEIDAIIVSHSHNDHRNEKNFGDNLVIDETNFKEFTQINEIAIELFLLPHGPLNSVACVFKIKEEYFLWFTDAGDISDIPRYKYTKIFGEIDYDKLGLKQCFDEGIYPKSLVKRIINDHTSLGEAKLFCENRLLDFNDIWFPLHMSENSLEANIDKGDYLRYEL